MSIALQNLYHK